MPPAEHDLGPLAMRVVGLLSSGPAAVQDVQQALARAGHDVAYTTVMTVLSRLYDKGVVVREKQERRYVYSLGKKAPAVTQGIMARMQKALFPADRRRPILALLDDESLSESDLRALRKRIDERLKAKP